MTTKELNSSGSKPWVEPTNLGKARMMLGIISLVLVVAFLFSTKAFGQVEEQTRESMALYVVENCNWASIEDAVQCGIGVHLLLTGHFDSLIADYNNVVVTEINVTSTADKLRAADTERRMAEDLAAKQLALEVEAADKLAEAEAEKARLAADEIQIELDSLTLRANTPGYVLVIIQTEEEWDATIQGSDGNMYTDDGYGFTAIDLICEGKESRYDWDSTYYLNVNNQGSGLPLKITVLGNGEVLNTSESDAEFAFTNVSGDCPKMSVFAQINPIGEHDIEELTS